MSTNLCEPRATRRVPGLPFGNVTQGGDQSYNNLSVASDLSVGSQAVIPLAYLEEIASLRSLEVTVCENLHLAAKDGLFSFANNAALVAGDSISLVSNNRFNVSSAKVGIDASLDVTISADRNLYLLGDNVVIAGNFAVPNVNACSLQCPGGNLTLETNSVLVLNAPTTAVNGNIAVNGNSVVGRNLNVGGNVNVSQNLSVGGNATVSQNLSVNGNANVSGTLTVCDLMCTGNLGIDTSSLILNSNLITNALLVNNSLNVLGFANVSGPLVVNNTLTAQDLIVNNTLTTQDLVINNVISGNNLTISNNVTTNNLAVNNNLLSENLTVSNNATVDNLTVNNNISAANVVVSNNATVDNLTVNNNTFSANLTVSNTATTNNLTVNNAIATQDLSVNNNAQISGTLFACNIVCINGNLSLQGANVSLTTNPNGNLSLQTNNFVVAANNSSFGGNVGVSGTLTAGTLAANNVTTSGNLTVNNLTVNVNADVGNNLNVGNSLNVCNVVCPNNLIVTAPNSNFSGNLRTPVNLTVGGTTQTLSLNVLSGGTFSAVNTSTLNVNTLATLQNVVVNTNVGIVNNLSVANVSVTTNLNVAGQIRANNNLVSNANFFVTNMAALAPGQLVDYNTANGRFGYVSDAVLAAGSVSDNLLGWNTANSTPSKLSIVTAAPNQLLTRNTTSGQIVSSNFANVSAVPAANFNSLGVDSGTGNVGRAPNFGVVWRNKNGTGDQAVLNGNTDTVTYDFLSGSGPFSYSGGDFTCLAAGDYSFLITCLIDVFAPLSYFILQENGVDFASTGYMSNQLTTSLVGARSCAAGAVYRVVFVNNSGVTVTLPQTQPTMNDVKIVRCGP